MDSALHQSSRPKAVLVALHLLALGTTIGFASAIAGAHSSEIRPIAYLLLSPIIAIPYVVIWFVFRGKNWARWLFLIGFGLALCSLAASFQELLTLPTLDIVVYSARMLAGFIAAVILVEPSSVKWFRAPKNDR